MYIIFIRETQRNSAICSYRGIRSCFCYCVIVVASFPHILYTIYYFILDFQRDIFVVVLLRLKAVGVKYLHACPKTIHPVDEISAVCAWLGWRSLFGYMLFHFRYYWDICNRIRGRKREREREMY